jgi:two-component system, chemotaxis family, chemotaxis protein CheY
VFGDNADMPRPTNALIVDDEPHVRAFVRLLLKEVGITACWEAQDGAQALAMILHHRPELVLLDVNLPVMSGLEVLEQMKMARMDIPVVMVTAQSAMKTVLESVRLGAVGYVLKHSPKAEALKALNEALSAIEQGGSGIETEDQPEPA